MDTTCTTDRARATDAELVREARAGDTAAFEALTARHFPMVYALAYARLGAREAAEDLAQEVFLLAYLHLGALTDPARFAAWLGRIARNEAGMWRRRSQSASRLVRLVPLDDLPAEPAAPASQGARTALEADEETRALHDALFRLPGALREVVLLHYFEDLTKAEIAERLEVHPATVGRQIEKALKAMKRTLEPMLRRAAPAFRHSGKAAARTTLLVAAVAAMSAPAKAALLAEAGASAILTATAQTAGVFAVAGGTASVGSGVATGIGPSLAAAWHTISSGGLFMTIKTHVAAVVAVVALLSGGTYYELSRPAPPAPQATRAPKGASERLSGENPVVGMPNASADRPSDGCVLSGTVVDIATDKPVAGVRLYRSNYHAATENVILVTDENGKFSTTVTSGSLVSIVWWPAKDGEYILDEALEVVDPGNVVPFGRQVITASQTDLVFQVKFRPAAPLSGLVTDPQGKPVEAASVCLLTAVGPFKTDAAGRFTVPAAPTDRDYDLFAISAQKDLAGIAHAKAGSPTTTIALAPTRDYAGEAKSQGDQPAPFLTFTMVPKINGSELFRLQQDVTTDAAGAFTARQLCPAVTYSARWQGDGPGNGAYEQGKADVDLAKIAVGKPVRLTVKMYGNALIGRVVDENRQPIEGAKIAIDAPAEATSDPLRRIDRMNLPGMPIVSGKDGAFAIKRLAAGEIGFRITAPGYAPNAFKARTDDVDFTAVLARLGAGGVTFAVTVKDEQGQPVADARLELRTRVGDSSGETTATATQTTDASGKARFAFTGLKAKQQGRGYIVCDKLGYCLAFRSAEALDDNFDTELVLEKESKTWRGRVVDAQGQPIAGAQVHVELVRFNSGTGLYVSLREVPPPAITADAEGRFELKRYSPSVLVSLRIAAELHDTVNGRFDPQQDGDAEKEFVMQPAWAIRGKIVMDGGGAVPGKWNVFADFPDGTGRGGSAAPDGSFRIQGIVEGACTVRAAPTTTETQRWVCLNRPAVTAVLGQTATVEVRVEPGTAVEGRIARPEWATGEAKKILYVLALSPDRKSDSVTGGPFAKPDADDKWTLYVPEGTFELGYSIGANGASVAAQKVVPTRQKIAVKKGQPVAGVVIDVK